MGFPLNSADLLAVLARTTDPGWLEPLLADDASRTVLGALAEIWARVASAADYDCAQGLITLASGGSPGSSTVTATTATGAGTLPLGTQLSDPRGVLALIQATLPVPVGPITMTINVSTQRMTESVNSVDDPAWRFEPTSLVADATIATPIVVTTTTPHRLATGQTVRVTGVLGNTAANVVATATVLTPTTFSLTGTIGVAAYAGGGLVQLAPLGLVIDSATPIQGGASDYLSAHGVERVTPRQAGEATYPYRLRVRNIPDAVTPVAISLAVQGPAQAADMDPVVVREAQDPMITPALAGRYNLAALNPLYMTGTTPAADSPMTDFTDDPLHALVSLREATAYFQLEPLSPVPDPTQVRFFTDDGFCNDPVAGYLDVIDHPTLIGALMAIWQGADTKRAAGVQFDVLLPIPRDVVDTGHGVVGVPATVLTLTPPAGKAWVLMDLVASHDAARDGTVPAPDDSHFLVFTFTDASTYTTAQWFRTDSEHLTLSRLLAAGFPVGQPIAQIEGVLASAAATLDLGLVVEGRVLEIAT